jgi:hypothetical protein
MSVKLPPKEKTVQRENVKKNQEFNNSCPWMVIIFYLYNFVWN